MPAQKKVKKFKRTTDRKKPETRPVVPKSEIVNEGVKIDMPKGEEKTAEILPPPPILTVEEQPDIQAQTEKIVAAPENPSEEPVVTDSQVEKQVTVSETNQVIDTIYPEKTDQVEPVGSPLQSNPVKKFLLLFAVFIAGVLIGGLTIYLVIIKPSGKTLSKRVPVPTVTPTEVLTPTEEPIDLEKYSIKVLNGSSVKGEAAKLRSSLESEGFKVSSTGNATSSAFQETIIRAKKSVEKSYVLKLIAFLSKSYTLAGTQESGDLEKTDVIIIIGGKLNP